MRGFVVVGEHLVASLDRVERRIIAAAVADTAELLGVDLREAGGRDVGGPLSDVVWDRGSAAPPTDPALARLLPPASKQDEELAAEFRRLTQEDLRSTKVENLRLVWNALRGRPGSLPVPRSDALRWAAAFGDVRLVLAARLRIETDEDAERIYGIATGDVEGERDGRTARDSSHRGARRDRGGADDVESALATLYAALTWLQDSLVSAALENRAP